MAKTETIVREYDDADRLIQETVTVVTTNNPVRLEHPIGFAPPTTERGSDA